MHINNNSIIYRDEVSCRVGLKRIRELVKSGGLFTEKPNARMSVYVKGYCFLSSFAPVLSRFFSDFSLSCLDSLNKNTNSKQMRQHECAFKEVLQVTLQINTRQHYVLKSFSES